MKAKGSKETNNLEGQCQNLDATKWNRYFDKLKNMLYLLLHVRFKIFMFILLIAISIMIKHIFSKISMDPHTFSVSSDNDICSRLGMEIIREGGNAADGAVTTAICIGTFFQQSSGFGGSGFALFLNSTSFEKEFINFRSHLPKNLLMEDLWSTCTDLDALKNKRFGTPPKPFFENIALPSFLRGMEYIQNKYGVKKFKDCIQKTIDLIENEWNGFYRFTKKSMNSRKLLPLASLEAHALAYSLSPFEYLRNDSFKIPGNLKFLKDLAAKGVDVLYNPDSHYFQEIINNSLLTSEELSKYQVKSGEILKFNFLQNYQILAPGFPSGGYFLKLILEVYRSVHAYFQNSPAFNNHFDLLALVLKECFVQMQDINPDNYYEKLKDSIINVLTESEQIMQGKHCLHKNTNHSKEVDYKPFQKGTSHISAVDSNGLYISITTTNNRAFGSSVITPNSKIVLNDDNCDAIEYLNNKNYFDMGIRSAMSPVIVYDDINGLYCSVGSKGSQKIPQGIAQTLINRFVLKKSWQESISMQRIYFYNGEIQYDASSNPFSEKFTKEYKPMQRPPQNVVFVSCNENGESNSYYDPRNV